MSTRPLTALAALLVAAAIPAVQAPAQTTAAKDIRCMMLSNLFAQAGTTPQAKETAAKSRLYYLGRVTANVPAAQYQAIIAREGKTMDAAKAGPEMAACVTALRDSVSSVEAAAQRAQAAAGLKVPTPAAPAGPKPAGR